MEHILNELNTPQREAVEFVNGPLMVIAGAGSGKTRVLTYRIAYLISQGVDPFNILSLTFTNKAAKEMRERIENLIGAEARNIWMGTFHSIFSKILRLEADKLNYPQNFTIYDTNDSKNLLKSIVKELNLDKDIYKPNILLSRISSLKNNLISYVSYASNGTLLAEDSSRKLNEMAMIYKTYQNRLFVSGSMDFDDLLFNTFILFRDFPEALNKYQNKFKYILVDEYQDTNQVQYMIVKRLAAMNENICVVGDDAQSIYAFRGANIQNILNFKNDYPDFKTVKLEQNYRSSQTIVNAANSLIKHNKSQIKKTVFSKKEIGSLIRVHKTMSDNEEGQLIGQTIFEQQMNQRLSFKDFAILYRTNAQSRVLEESLRRRNIPYKIFGGLSFYQRKEVKDLLAYFRLIINSKDEESFKRVINYPARGIGNTTLQKLTICSRNNNVSLFECIDNPIFHSQIGVNNGTLTKLSQFALLINSFKVQLKEDAFELANSIAKSSNLLYELDKDKTPEGISRYENIQELLNAIKDFSEKNKKNDAPASLDFFMQDVALLTDQDNDEDKDNIDKVSLMTIHAAKGLEFSNVLVVGLEENLFPSQLSVHSREELEEERRLFYVAITRAKKHLDLSYATSRWRWGQLTDCEPSRFLNEIDDDFLDWKFSKNTFSFEKPNVRLNINKAHFDKKTSKPKQINTNQFVPKNLTKKHLALNKTSSSHADNNALQSGMKVNHDRFGLGKILQIEGVGSNRKATVFFEAHGKKVLLLKFAKLHIIN
ncbi:MAG: ATP-dependent helicase [Flavobacteriales bacterium]